MKNTFYIKTRLDDLLYDNIPRTEEKRMDYYDIQKFVFWIFNCGNYRTEHELRNSLKKYQEELMSIEGERNPTPMQLNPIKRKISLLKDILED